MLFQSGLYLSFDKWCEAERCFTYYFAITLSFWGNCLFKFLLIFLLDVSIRFLNYYSHCIFFLSAEKSPILYSFFSFYFLSYKSMFLFSLLVLSNFLWPHGLQHVRLPCPSSSPRVYSNSCPLSRRCHSTISSSVTPFSSCLQSSPASGSFPMIQLFTSSGQSIGVSASVSLLPMTVQRWFPLGLTRLISLQSKGLSRIFSGTTIQKHQFFGAQLSLQSNSLYVTIGKTIAVNYRDLCWQSNVSAFS